MSIKKRLYRSRDDRMIAGVCGGIGEYFSIDPTLIRLVLLFLVIWGGGGALVYLIAWIVIPEPPEGYESPAKASSETSVEPAEPKAEPGETAALPEEPTPATGD